MLPDNVNWIFEGYCYWIWWWWRLLHGRWKWQWQGMYFCFKYETCDCILPCSHSDCLLASHLKMNEALICSLGRNVSYFLTEFTSFFGLWGWGWINSVTFYCLGRFSIVWTYRGKKDILEMSLLSFPVVLFCVYPLFDFSNLTSCKFLHFYYDTVQCKLHGII